jgi:hypothetical protein
LMFDWADNLTVEATGLQYLGSQNL